MGLELTIGYSSILGCRITSAVIVVALSSVIAFSAQAGMGPCQRDAEGFLTCGSGEGAARVITKTISPSGHLAFAWRLTDRPPTDIPRFNDSNLENLILRIDDGAILAKSRGAYWDLSTKIAKAYLMVSWSPDSRLLFAVQQRETTEFAELFSFDDDGTTLGPFDLLKVIRPAIEAKLQNAVGMSGHDLIFPAHPKITVDNQGIIHAVVVKMASDGSLGPQYDATIRVIHGERWLNAEVVSLAPHGGVSISVTVH